MRQTYLDKKEDLEWLRDTHKVDISTTTDFVSAILYGNEDAPYRVEIFNKNHYKAIPVRIYQANENGNLGLIRDIKPFNISSGEPSTLKTYRKIAAALTGENSPATKFFDEKIKEQGEDEIVVQDERQVLMLIVQMGILKKEPQDGKIT